jgi:hypothetical protein
MATSPLYNWPEPDNTDLVKNGALAIRTAVNAIDTSMGDLLGGTTGQVLSKTSNTNMDFTWVTTDDANAIQNSIVDAKGDIIAASANDTPARLAVGANNTLLVADSTAATGLKWDGAWTTFTPTLTNITIGNGGITARYQQVGKTVNFQIGLSLGTTSSVSGFLQMTLPVIAANAGAYSTLLYDDSAATWYEGYFRNNAAGNADMYLYVILTNGTYGAYSLSGNTVPFTWAAGDYLIIRGSYEAA